MIRGAIVLLSILAESKWVYINNYINILLESKWIYIKNSLNILLESMVLVKSGSSDEDESDNENIPTRLDKGKGKAVEDDTEMRDNSDSNSGSRSSSGSDIDSDEELNEDIQNEIDFLTQEPKTKDNLSRIITLKKLLRSEIQKKGPLPTIPDYWNHGSKPNTDANTSSKPEPEITNPAQGFSNQNPEASGLNANVNPEFGSKPREIDSNVSESTPGIATQSTPGTTTQSTESNEKPKQTPTEYVHELESTEPPSYVWDDSD
jgi:hypothetical protein